MRKTLHVYSEDVRNTAYNVCMMSHNYNIKVNEEKCRNFLASYERRPEHFYLRLEYVIQL